MKFIKVEEERVKILMNNEFDFRDNIGFNI